MANLKVKFLSIMSWFFGISFFIIGLLIFSQEIQLGFIIIIGSLLLMPYTKQMFKSKFSVVDKNKMTIAGIVLVVLPLFFLPKSDKTTSLETTENVPVEIKEKPILKEKSELKKKVDIEPKEILYNKSLTESDYNLNIKEHKNSLPALESIPIDVNDYLVQEVFVKEEYVQSSTIEMDLLSMADLSEMPLMKILMELVINQRSMNGYNDIETNVNSTYLDTIKKFLLLVSKDPYVSKEESFVVENVIVTVSYNAPGHLKIKHTLK